MITPVPGASVYEQIASELRDDIITGRLAAGQKMPSETTLLQRYEVSRVTVRRALAVLRNQGLIVIRHGHGGYVREEPEYQDLTLPPGAAVTCRMPTSAERLDHDLGEGVPVFVVAAEDGSSVVYPGDRWRLRQPSETGRGVP